MTIASYSELVSELESWFNANYAARIPSLIRLFEARMNRRLTSPEMAVTSTSLTVADEDTYALPTDFLQARSVYLATDPKTVLDALSPQQLRKYYSDSATGQPQAYAVIGENIVLAPTPDGEYSLVLDYFQQLNGLSVTNTTNWLLDDHPDAYMFGVLALGNKWLRDDVNAADMKAAWDEVIAEIQKLARRKALPAGPLAMRPSVTE